MGYGVGVGSHQSQSLWENHLDPLGQRSFYAGVGWVIWAYIGGSYRGLYGLLPSYYRDYFISHGP